MIDLQEHLSSQEASDTSKLEKQCADLDKVLKDVLKTLEKLLNKPKGFRGRIREVVQSDNLADTISGHKEKIQELRGNLMFIANLDTNRQVHRLGNSSVVHTSQETEQINNCPPASPIFQGRQAILDRMAEYFNCDLETKHIYVLYGLGGVGKTQIALKSIEQSRSRFSDVFFIDASSKEAIILSFKEVATVKKIGTRPGAAEQWLVSKKQPWLLLFDNADDPKLDLIEHFPKCNHGNIIVTSRNPELRIHAAAHSSFTKVADMEVKEAVELLLTRAMQDSTAENQTRATSIVKELHCLPLAIIQAGAFIAKSHNLKGYLGLYRQNKAYLLSEKPNQSPVSYAWTVYTTWKISFEQLSPVAQQLLQLCSFLHYDGISENIFENASKYTFPSSGPSPKELEGALKFLSEFWTNTVHWDSLKFAEIINEIGAYSLLSFDPAKEALSMHPLVHEWCRSTTTDQLNYFSTVVGILGMCIENIPEENVQVSSIHLHSHVNAILGTGREIMPDYRAQFAQIFSQAGNYKVGKQLQLSVLEKCKALHGDLHPSTLLAMARLASTHRHLGAYPEAKELEEEVLNKCRDLLGDMHPDTLLAMLNLAATLCQLGAYQQAKNLEEEVLMKRRVLLGNAHLHTLVAMANLASTLRRLGAYEEARNLQEEVLQKRRIVLGDTHSATLLAMANLAITYRELGVYQKAKSLALEVVEKRRVLLGSTHPDTFLGMANLALIHGHLGEFQEAKHIAAEVLKGRTTLLGDEHPHTLDALVYLAAIHRELHEYQDAKDLGEEALKKSRAVVGDSHPETLAAMSSLAATYYWLGDYQKAKHLQEEVVEKRSSLVGDVHPDTLYMANLARTLYKLNEFHQAKELQETVLQHRRQHLGTHHPATVGAMRSLAATYHQLGQVDEAENLKKMIADNKTPP